MKSHGVDAVGCSDVRRHFLASSHNFSGFPETIMERVLFTTDSSLEKGVETYRTHFTKSIKTKLLFK